MAKRKTTDSLLAEYADAVASGRTSAFTAGKNRGREGMELMNTIQTLYEALRPVPVPETLASRVREQVRREIAGRAAPAEAEPGIASRLRTTARAFLRRAGELVININLGEMLGGQVAQRTRPAEVYAYSVVEALDKAARRRKARILLDSEGRIYEVPQSVLRKYQLSSEEIRRRRV